MQFRTQVRETAQRLLREARTLAGNAVYSERDTPVERYEGPALIVYTPHDRGESRGPAGVPKFTSTLSLAIDAVVEGQDRAAVVDQLDELTEQAENALLTDPRFVSMRNAAGNQLLEEVASKETQMAIDGSGDRHSGRARIVIGLRYSEYFEPVVRPPLQRVALNVAARLGAAPPLVIAIRRDFYYGASAVAGSVAAQAAAILSPPQWHHRAPWFATAAGDPITIAGDPITIAGAPITFGTGAISWPAATQPVIDQEIADAAAANIGAFAFVSYDPAAEASRALALYLTSTRRAAVRFCLLGQMAGWGLPGPPYAPSVVRDLALFVQPDYLRVLGARPLYPVLIPAGVSLFDAATALAWLRRASIMQGTGEPYIVALSDDAALNDPNVTLARMLGADAFGSYWPRAAAGGGAPYAELTAAAEADWALRLGSRFPMLPTAIAGFDARPEVQTPEPISGDYDAGSWYGEGAPAPIAAHVAAAVDFVRANPAACAAAALFVTGWNDLSGLPLFRTFVGGNPAGDASRIAALGQALAPPGAAVATLADLIEFPPPLPA